MKIKYTTLFFATALSTISLNIWLTQLAEANEGKVIREIGGAIIPQVINHAATAYPLFGAIVMGIGAISIGICTIFLVTSIINK
jgi:hypothetical protein